MDKMLQNVASDQDLYCLFIKQVFRHNTEDLLLSKSEVVGWW